MSASELWDEGLETTPWPKLQERGFERLKQQLARVYARSDFYRRKYDEAGVKVHEIRHPDDLARVPFFTKTEERRSQQEEPPLGGHLCADLDDVVRIHASSGTSGAPTFFAMTHADVDTWAEAMARAYYTLGMRRSDTYTCLSNLSMFTGGVPSISAAQRVGAAVAPVGASAGTERALRLAHQLGTTIMGLTPSFAIYLGEVVEEVLGIRAQDFGLRLLLVGGEPGGQVPSIRRQIEEIWNCPLRDVMGLGEIMPTTFVESSDEAALHFTALDEVYIELVDEQGEPIDFTDGAEGELVYTTTMREATPLLRFRSGDKVRIVMGPTPSGRTAPRIEPVGRLDDMLFVRGVNLHPSAVRDVVGSFAPETAGHMQIVLTEPGPIAPAPVKVEVELGPGGQAGEDLAARLEAKLQMALHFRAKVVLVPHGSLERSTTKTALVRVDPRGQGGS